MANLTNAEAWQRTGSGGWAVETEFGTYRIMKVSRGYVCYRRESGVDAIGDDRQLSQQYVSGEDPEPNLVVFKTVAHARRVCEWDRAKLQANAGSADELKRLSEQFSAYNVFAGCGFDVRSPKHMSYIICYNHSGYAADL